MITGSLFSKKIIDWYNENHRSLPWRSTKDPYRIWLSEIILQQTRVAQGLPYYQTFIDSFPTVQDLAGASSQSVLRHWQGLGYYSRARNLHKCAQTVVEKFDGRFPQKYTELITLPGIGPYTAAAIASFSFKEPVAVVDGNVFRVLSRVFGMEDDIASNQGKGTFTKKANELIDQKQPDLFNQALMEFGALHCLPQNPKCDDCIFSKHCVANQRSLQKILPIKSKKTKVRNRYLYYFILRSGEKIFMRQRMEKDIWQGLFDFYLVEKPKNTNTKKIVEADRVLSQSELVKESKTVIHILSHQKLHIKFLEMNLGKKGSSVLKKLGLKPFSTGEVNKLPKPIVIQRYLVAAGD